MLGKIGYFPSMCILSTAEIAEQLDTILSLITFKGKFFLYRLIESQLFM